MMKPKRLLMYLVPALLLFSLLFVSCSVNKNYTEVRIPILDKRAVDFKKPN